mgnify:FL=1
MYVESRGWWFSIDVENSTEGKKSKYRVRGERAGQPQLQRIQNVGDRQVKVMSSLAKLLPRG